MATRTITITLSSDFSNAISHSQREANTAIGRLAMWAIEGESGRYSGPCKMYGTCTGDVMATYHNQKGEETYSIMASFTPNEDEGKPGSYSFHS